MEVVRTGAGLDLWEEDSIAKRKAVYAKIAEMLNQPQPPVKKIRTLTLPEPQRFNPGELLSYRCVDGELILLWVQCIHRYQGEALPCCAAMDWKGPVLPSPKEILALKPIETSNHKFNQRFMEDYARDHGLTRPPKPPGLGWSGFAMRGLNKHDFDENRIKVIPGEWTWDLAAKTQGPYVPHWIEIGTKVTTSLTATLAFESTLARSADWREPRLPATVRTRGPVRDAKPLGIRVKLPVGKPSKHSGLYTLKRSRHVPTPGDLFVVNVMGRRWVVGRVILCDGQFAGGPADVLVYFYKQEFNDPAEILVPMALDLLIPPGYAGRHNWSRGTFFHIANRPLTAEELPARHVFGPRMNGYYCDAYGVPTTPPAEDELVGSVSVGDFGYPLASALGMNEA